MPNLMPFLLHAVVGLVGVVVVAYTLLAAMRTVVLPRGDNVLLTNVVFLLVARPFRHRANKQTTYEARDSIMALLAPIGLLILPVSWLILVGFGYALIFWGIGVGSWYDAFKVSGSSLFTLGFFFPQDTALATLLVFSEATIGLGLVALLISYLPTMYSAFSKRETLVTLLEVRADSPPSAVTLIIRAQGIRGLDYLKEMFAEWEIWFAEVDESHTSLPALNFFRSPHPDRSWITASGAIMDAAALMSSVVDIPRTPEAQLCIRAGFVALRHICDYFGLAYPADPHYPAQPISITRQEWEEACDELAAAGVPIKADRDQAWADFAGWRVNYDVVLLSLCQLLMAPYAQWSSDRGLPRGK